MFTAALGIAEETAEADVEEEEEEEEGGAPNRKGVIDDTVLVEPLVVESAANGLATGAGAVAPLPDALPNVKAGKVIAALGMTLELTFTPGSFTFPSAESIVDCRFNKRFESPSPSIRD